MKRFFLLRVELHDLPKGVDSRPIYDKLHEELLAKNPAIEFYKNVTGGTGTVYELPDGVYEGKTTKTKEEFLVGHARDFAMRAIANTVTFVKESTPNTTLRGSALVAEVDGFNLSWQGLKQVS